MTAPSPMPMEIRIENLRLRTIIGIEAWERETLQDVVINVWLRFDGAAAAASDAIADTVNYRALKKEIMAFVEASSYGLLEKLAAELLAIVLRHEGVQWGRVQVDKPGALRFADSVAVAVEATAGPGGPAGA